MSNPVLQCLQQLHLHNDAQLQQRAEQFLGQFSAQVPAKIFSKGPNCKPMISIQLAHESLGMYDWDRKLAAQLAGCKLAAYDAAVSAVRRQLNLQPTVTLDTLAVAFGSTAMVNQAQSLWESFKEDYLTQLATAERQKAKKELKQPQWQGAVFYACGKALGVMLDKARLHELCGCSQAELNKCLKTIREISSKAITSLRSDSGSTTRVARKRRTQEDEAPTEKRPRTSPSKAVSTPSTPSTPIKTTSQPGRKGPVSGIVSMIPRGKYTDTRRYKDYAAWRQQLLTELRSK